MLAVLATLPVALCVAWGTAQGIPTEVEPNETPEQAGALDPATPVRGSLGQGDVDRFTFTVDATLATELFDLVIEAETVVTVTLADADGRVLQERQGAGGALRSLHLPEGGYRFAIAGEDLAKAEGRAMVVLVTDGEESYGGDPRAAIEMLLAAGIDTINIVGFALDDDEVRERFRGWADLGNGRYLDAADGAALASALNEILQPEFVVLDAVGGEVARGRVNSGAVAVPSGIYRIRVLSTPEKVIDGVRVVEQEVRLTVALREGTP